MNAADHDTNMIAFCVRIKGESSANCRNRQFFSGVPGLWNKFVK